MRNVECGIEGEDILPTRRPHGHSAFRIQVALTVTAAATNISAPMPPFYRIEELPPLAGQTVVTRGWVMTTRSSGKIAFIVLRDGTGYLQVVLSKKDVPDAAWQAFGTLTQETSVEVTGAVRSD